MQQSVTIRDHRDIIDLINRGVIQGGNSFLIVLIALGGTFIDAYDFSSLGIGAVQLKAQFNLTAFELGSITASMAFGALFGAMVGGYYVDKIGRLRMFLLDLMFFVVAAIGAALSTNLEMLIFFRLLMGVGVGLDFPVALSFIAEYTAMAGKGTRVAYWQPAWFCASTSVFLLVIPMYYLGAGDNLWRWAVGFGAIPALIVLILRYMYMQESPMWAALQGDLPEAARILERSYGLKVTVPEGVRQGPSLAKTYSFKNYARIFSPQYRKRTILTSIICACQSMEYYALAFYLPSVAIIIFGKGLITAVLGSAFVNLWGIPGGFLGAYLVPRIGLRRLTIAGSIVVICSLIVIGTTRSFLPPLAALGLLCVFLFGHSSAQGQTGMTMAALSYPTSFRGAGTGFNQGILRIGSILGFYFFPLLLGNVGLGPTVLILALVPLTILVACLCVHWEPVGRNIDAEDFAEPRRDVVGKPVPVG
jgi:putative MFS transporter